MKECTVCKSDKDIRTILRKGGRVNGYMCKECFTDLSECACGCGTKINKYSRVSFKELSFKNGHYGMANKRPINERFMSFIKERKVDKCWEWSGSKNSKGYGRFHDHRGKWTGAHRVSYEIHKGMIPKGMHVLHHCDNPSCVNPDHLFIGNNQDNMDDKLLKGRQPALLLDGDVINIIAYHKLTGLSNRQIAAMYNISRGVINNIINLKTKTYKDVASSAFDRIEVLMSGGVLSQM